MCPVRKQSLQAASPKGQFVLPMPIQGSAARKLVEDEVSGVPMTYFWKLSMASQLKSVSFWWREARVCPQEAVTGAESYKS